MCLHVNEQFDDVILRDECSVLLEKPNKLSFHRKWEQPKLKGQQKKPVKVHMWARNLETWPNPTRYHIQRKYGHQILPRGNSQIWFATIDPV